MVKEPAYGTAYDGFGIPVDVPRKSEPRSDVVLIARITLGDIKRVLCDLQIVDRKRNPRERIGERRRRELAREFVVITNSVINGKAPGDPPRVLRKKGERLVVERAERISKALNEDAWISEAVGLYRCYGRTPSEALRDQRQGVAADAANGDQPARRLLAKIEQCREI